MAPLIPMLLKILLPMVVREVASKVITKAKEAPMGEAAVGAVKSKTMWASAILGVLGVLEANQGLLSAFIGADKMGTVMIVVAAIMAALRVVTGSKLSDK